jgi:hypothetical protein
MIVQTKNGPVTLPPNPPGGGYFLSADSMEPIPLTTEQLWKLAPSPVPVSEAASPTAVSVGPQGPVLNPPPLSAAAPTGGGSAVPRSEGVTPPPPVPPPVPITGWPLFLYTAIAAGVGAFLAASIALHGMDSRPSPTPTPEPTPIPSPLPSPGPATSPLGSSLKTYLSTTPSEWQRIGQQVSSGQITTQKDLLSAVAGVSKPVWDQFLPMVGTSTSTGQYTDAKGNITNAQALGAAMIAAGKEASR